MLALLGGVLASLAFPNPLSIDIHWPGGILAFFCLIPLFGIRESSERPSDFWRWGYIFGFVYFGISTFWLSYMPALGLLAPFVWLLLVLYLACYPAVFMVGYRLLLKKGIPAWSAAAPLWVALEYLRNYFFTGFPWAALGYAQHQNPLMMALAPFTGVWGLSFVTVLINSNLYSLIGRWPPAAGPERLLEAKHGLSARFRLLGFGLLLTVLAAGAVYERWNLARDPGGDIFSVAALQANIDQNQPWDHDYQRMTLNTFYSFLSRASTQGARLAVWPESSFPGIFNWDRSIANEVKGWSDRLHIMQAIGTDTMERGDNAEYRYFNSLVLLDARGAVCAVTSKIHLVPFGEYVPFKDTLLAFLKKIVNRYGVGDFTPGKRRIPMRCNLEGKPIALGALICFESLFPQYAAALVRKGSQFLVVITLDTWFGATSAPAQHAVFSALRAAETGRYVVRAGATGISCFYDPQGRLLGLIPLNTGGALTIPIRFRTSLTTFVRLGPWLVWLCLLILLWDFFIREKYFKRRNKL